MDGRELITQYLVTLQNANPEKFITYRDDDLVNILKKKLVKDKILVDMNKYGSILEDFLDKCINIEKSVKTLIEQNKYANNQVKVIRLVNNVNNLLTTNKNLLHELAALNFSLSNINKIFRKSNGSVRKSNDSNKKTKKSIKKKS